MSRGKTPPRFSKAPRRRGSAPAAAAQTGVAPAPRLDRRVIAFAAALAALTIALFASLRTAGFIGLDDPGYVPANPHVTAGLTTSSLAWAWSAAGYAANWHPLTWLSHMLDVELFGLWAGGHHLTSVLLHALNTVLLFLLLYRTTSAVGRSAFVAALFAVHPMHVESVAWIAERKDVLSTLFWFLTMLAYAAWTRRPGVGRYLIVCASFTAGLLSKPMLVTLPCVLLLFDLWPLGRWTGGLRGLRPRLVEKLPLFVLAAASSVITLVVQQRGGATTDLDTLPAATRLANALVAYMQYLGKLVWPTNMAIFYPYREAIPWWWIACALVAMVALSVFAWRARNDRAYLTTGWFWFAGALVPVIGLIQVGQQAMADRYTYVPYVGLFIAIAWAGHWALSRLRLPPSVAVGIALADVAGSAVLTASQVRVWQSHETIWKHAAAVTSGNYIAANELGMLLAAENRHADALQYFETAARDNPSFPEARNNLGLTYVQLGRLQDALAQYELAVRLKPAFPKAEHNYGNALMMAGKPAEAEPHYRKAISLQPDLADAHHDLGVLLAAQSRVAEAVAQLEDAVRLNPDSVKSRFVLGMLYGAANRLDDAASMFRDVLQRDPSHTGAREMLAKTEAMRGKGG
jgi:tetratricopeptide (TPR) repeat protein